MDYHSLHDLETQLAEARGQPLPEVALSKELSKLISKVEVRFKVEVLPAPHTFRTGALGSTNSEEAFITLFVHSQKPQEESMRTLFHESGHRLQIETGHFKSYYRSTIEGYFDCELNADERGWQLAEEWGYEHLHDAEYRDEQRRLHDAAREAASALIQVTGSRNAYVITALLKTLSAGYERNLSRSLSARFDWAAAPGASYADLANALWAHPEAFVGFDRSRLRGAWRLTHYSGMPESLPLQDETRANDCLLEVLGGMASDWHYDPDDHRYRIMQSAIVEDEPDTNVVWTSGNRFDLSAYVNLLQTIVLGQPRLSLALTWNVYELEEQSIYEAAVEWHPQDWPGARTGRQAEASDEELPELRNWRLYCAFDKHGRQTGRYEDALRAYINSFSQPRVRHLPPRHGYLSE